MYSNFKEKAIGGGLPLRALTLAVSVATRLPVVACIEYVKEAVQEDQAGNYQKAFDLYKIALEYFSTHLKYEKNPRSKAAISEKARVCARRVLLALHVFP